MAAGEPDHTNAALRHLFIWLHALNRTLDAAVAQRRRANAALQRHAGNMAELNAEHASQLLNSLHRLVAEGPEVTAALALDAGEARLGARGRGEGPPAAEDLHDAQRDDDEHGDEHDRRPVPGEQPAEGVGERRRVRERAGDELRGA